MNIAFQGRLLALRLPLLVLCAGGSAFAAEPLVVTYEIVATSGTTAQTSKFLFARDGQTVAFIDSRKTYRDIWDLAATKQQLRLRRVVDVKHSTIEFLPNELTLRGHMPKWESLQSPFGNDVQGNCDAKAVHVVECVAGNALPAKVVMRFGATEVQWTQLDTAKDRQAFERAARVPDDYALWDAADFGDQEYDRDLQALLPYAELDPHSPRIHVSNERPATHHSHDGHRH